MRALRITFASIFIFFTVSEAALPAAACTSLASSCTEWVGAAQAPGRALVYRTHPLEVSNEAITRALVVIHGIGRNADSYFRTAVMAASRAAALENTAVVAPRFASGDGNCRDVLAPREVNWICTGPESWRNGGPALGHPGITSYDFVDALVERLARRDVFPNLKSIVVAGHSAGGQLVGRYAMSSPLHERLGVPVTYVVANPSSYTYPDDLRPAVTVAGCAGFDRWPYGLQDRRGYSARFPRVALTKQLVERPITFLVGELDVLQQQSFDASCEAMAQGPTRLARGLAYVKHLNERHGARHRALVVPACGHSARCMFTSDAALPFLFP